MKTSVYIVTFDEMSFFAGTSIVTFPRSNCYIVSGWLTVRQCSFFQCTMENADSAEPTQNRSI